MDETLHIFLYCCDVATIIVKMVLKQPLFALSDTVLFASASASTQLATFRANQLGSALCLWVWHQNSSIRNSRMTFLRQLLNGKLNQKNRWKSNQIPFLLNWTFNDTVARAFWTKRITDESITPVQIWLLWLSAAHTSLYGDGMQTNSRMFGWSILNKFVSSIRCIWIWHIHTDIPI